MGILDAKALRDDIVARLITDEVDLETSAYLDRILELAEMEEAEHQFLNDPFDRSVALVLQLFQDKDLDPWAVDLSAFLEMFSTRIENAEDIDLPTCGRLIRMAWQVLRGQAESLIERQNHGDEVDEPWIYDGGWESDFDDNDYNFSVGIITGTHKERLPDMFAGRIQRDEGRPVTLGELLMGLKAASRISEEQNLRLKIAEKRRASLEIARERFSGSLHVEDLEGDIRRTWEAMRMRTNPEDQTCTLSAISEELADRSMESGTTREEANAEAQVAAMVATLFLVNRGYASIEQKDAIDGSVILTDLYPDESDFEELSSRLHPPPEIEEVV